MSMSYDLVVFSATPCGIACALTASRQGLRTLLINRTSHVGGFLTSGCGGWEAPYDGHRSPILTEFLDAISAYYSETYGSDSPQYRSSRPDPDSRDRLGRPRVEPRVAQLVFEQLLNAEKNLTVTCGYIPWSAIVTDGKIETMRFIAFRGEDSIEVKAPIFVDASYEGDLAMVCGADYSVGRESNEEFNEPHAGRIFTRHLEHAGGKPGWPRDSVEGRLKIRHMGHSAGETLDHPETGRGDGFVMAYNFRPILTDDPDNRVIPARPANYHRFDLKSAFVGGFVKNLPNRKVAWNGARLIGPHHSYPEGSWATRLRIEQLYRDYMLSLLWYLRNEADLPPETKALWQSLGLARDEFVTDGHFPHEIYVRESIRIKGLKTFTEHDGLPDPLIGRTPIHPDSIAMTDWPLDSVAVTADKYQGSTDGVFLLAEQSRPAQVPFGCLVSENRANLLVPLCLSATHVGWGCIRLEPVWVQCGEAAALAAIQTIKNQRTLHDVDIPDLQRTLINQGAVLAFLNEMETLSGEDRAAIQWGALRGFFSTYNANPLAEIGQIEDALWQTDCDPSHRAREIHALTGDFPQVGKTRLNVCLDLYRSLNSAS